MRLGKKLVCAIMGAALAGAILAGCGGGGSQGASEPSAEGTGENEYTLQAPTGDRTVMDIRIISKSLGNPFYEETFRGAYDAANDMDVLLTTYGPEVETDIERQVELVREAVDADCDAIILAACDTASLAEPLTAAREAGIPVIGFDSGVPGDETGAVLATAATDNVKAGAKAADKMIADPGFQKAVLGADAGKPAVLAILAQDATSGSICERVDGFVEEAIKELEALDGLAGAVDVSGYERWTQPSESPAVVRIVVTVPPSSGEEDIQAAAQTIFETKDLAGIFAANQSAVNGILAASDGGKELDRTNGRYKNIIVAGFDGGEAQREAVAKGFLLGSVAQDPYQMGYQSVALALKAAQDQPVADIDTGSWWYDAENIDSEDISVLIYD